MVLIGGRAESEAAAAKKCCQTEIFFLRHFCEFLNKCVILQSNIYRTKYITPNFVYIEKAASPLAAPLGPETKSRIKRQK